ncbi:mechanosensitive ion channel domain-containing protein [Cellulomonas telluris]|uniref:mechanosensitive ion channel domain-containing protein n=1 Tax=Cellulomonas telluris TaxID=2306636 RepID=UPI00279580F5|nr:mechanosensitive ion channel domain-containing protein [Cellulomonas telluris]
MPGLLHAPAPPPAPLRAAATPSPSPEVVEVVRDVGSAVVPLLAVAGGVVVGYLLATAVGALVRRLAPRSALAADLSRRSRRPLRVTLLVVSVWVALRLSTDPSDTWRPGVEHALLVATIVAVTWLVGSLAFVFEDLALQRYRVDVKDNRHARRVRTQVQVLRRITVAVLVVIGAAAVLLTFPGARAVGASVFASAGLLSIVAGLAAQSSLANVFAGLQLAFTDAIRVDDVVVVADEWGRIEEITLTYVVVHVWDDRRLILPSTYFTTTPFENWTRRAAELLGTVELDVDWEVPVEAMRAELTRLLSVTDLWDGRVGILQVTDAVGGVVRVRALASAVDAPTLFDLRCYVREGLVAWLQREAPQGLPRTRWEGGDAPVRPSGVPTPPGTQAPTPAGGRPGHDGPEPPPAPSARPVEGRVRTPSRPGQGSTVVLPIPGEWASDDTQRLAPAGQDARLFTGSIDAVARSQAFSGPGQEAIEEREQAASGGVPQIEEPAHGDRPRPSVEADAPGDGLGDAPGGPPVHEGRGGPVPGGGHEPEARTRPQPRVEAAGERPAPPTRRSTRTRGESDPGGE